MQYYLLALIPILAPLSLFLYSLVIVAGKKSRWALPAILAEYLGWFGILVALYTAFLVYLKGTLQTPTLGWDGLGFSLRLDPLSITMLLMISLLGFIILRFSRNYLEGDARKMVFYARLSTTIASVQLLVLSGNLLQLLVFWTATSICLHYLLVFYRERPQAIAAARKKFVIARLGDLSLFVAVVLLYLSFGTGDLQEIFTSIQNELILNNYLMWATILLVITAVLKSAQFPTYGWLIEVLETPTPVSALLHAGLLNAGPFLMVRLALLMNESVPASLLLISIGGITAMFASVVFLTQPSVKVALGYSSIAHMGFMLMICGFGVYTAAILHLVAHSFYKAHAFLSSGSVVESVKSGRVVVPRRRGNSLKIALSIGLSFLFYLGCCYLWGVHPEENFSLMATGAIIIMGLSQIMTPTLDSTGNFKGVLLSALMAFAVALAFFSLEHGAHLVLHSQIPAIIQTSFIVKVATTIILCCFVLLVVLQLFAPKLKYTATAYKLGVHLRNGFYVNIIFDRWIGALKRNKFKWANLDVRENP
ncbi:NADH dehydrogenase [Marivirga lumbricoides]|uniref:Probable inorganic carbon transporter subunit DabB n=1 Tax=Marivirga lumbricoides TaxID=1046115 RepID=A0ABQ1LCK0_9BACT|nr:NADH dehydrogenase [Marivirga lumbricoides]